MQLPTFFMTRVNRYRNDSERNRIWRYEGVTEPSAVAPDPNRL